MHNAVFGRGTRRRHSRSVLKGVDTGSASCCSQQRTWCATDWLGGGSQKCVMPAFCTRKAEVSSLSAATTALQTVCVRPDQLCAYSTAARIDSVYYKMLAEHSSTSANTGLQRRTFSSGIWLFSVSYQFPFSQASHPKPAYRRKVR